MITMHTPMPVRPPKANRRRTGASGNSPARDSEKKGRWEEIAHVERSRADMWRHLADTFAARRKNSHAGN